MGASRYFLLIRVDLSRGIPSRRDSYLCLLLLAYDRRISWMALLSHLFRPVRSGTFRTLTGSMVFGRRYTSMAPAIVLHPSLSSLRMVRCLCLFALSRHFRLFFPFRLFWLAVWFSRLPSSLWTFPAGPLTLTFIQLMAMFLSRLGPLCLLLAFLLLCTCVLVLSRG